MAGVPPKAPLPPKLSESPSPDGMFGAFGGSSVPEAATASLQQISEAFARAESDSGFWDDLLSHLRTFAGRATPMFAAEGLTAHARERLPRGDGARLWLKREDLAHTGSLAINHALGFALLAVKSGQRRLIAPATGGAHAVAVAAAAAHFGLGCDIFASAADLQHAANHLAKARHFGAQVIDDAASGSNIDTLLSALQAWAQSEGQAMMIPAAAVGPHPFPILVREFQSIIGRETMAQSLRQMTKLPDVIVSCVGMSAEAAGIFYPFIDDAKVKLVGVEAGGRSGAPGEHAAPLSMGHPGAMLGHHTYTLRSEDGEAIPTLSAAPGLGYPLAGPEHAFWKDAGRVRYTVAGDSEAMHAVGLLARTEGILASLEAGHAVAEALKLAAELKADQNIVINLSGRGETASV